MDDDHLDIRARMIALELLVTELVADRLRSAPDSAERAEHAAERLGRAALEMPLDVISLDEEARLRIRIKAAVTELLEASLAKTRAT